MSNRDFIQHLNSIDHFNRFKALKKKTIQMEDKGDQPDSEYSTRKPVKALLRTYP